MEYRNKAINVGTSFTTGLSATTSQKFLVKTIHASNLFSGATSIDVRWYDSSESTSYYLAYDISVPNASSFQLLDGTFVLEPFDYIEAKCGDANALDITFSYLEITDSEG